VNLAAENQVRPAIHHESIAAILLYEFWGVCAKGARKRDRSEQGYNDENKNAAKTPEEGKSHDGITSTAV